MTGERGVVRGQLGSNGWERLYNGLAWSKCTSALGSRMRLSESDAPQDCDASGFGAEIPERRFGRD